MKNILLTISLFIVAALLNTCGDMDETYKEFIVPNGILYPGRALSPVIHSGNNRLAIEWNRGADPKINKAKIFWNNYTDSIVVAIPENAATISQMIDPLPENTYTFIIKNYDDEGNVSVPAEITGKSYGPIYQSGLYARTIADETISRDNVWNITWGVADLTNGAIGSELVYEKKEGGQQTVFLKIKEEISKIGDFLPESEYKYRTLYKPDSLSLDTFYTDYVISNIPAKPPYSVSTAGWIATASSKQNDANGPEYAIDGSTSTQWHSLPAAAYPHWIAFDMIKPVVVDHVVLTMRTASPNNTFKDFYIEGSMDGVDWTRYGTFVFKANSPLIPQKFIIEGSPTMKHIRVYCVNSHTNPYAVLAEFQVYEK